MKFNNTNKLTLCGRECNEENYFKILKHCAQEDMTPVEYFNYMDDFSNKSYETLMKEKNIVQETLENHRQERTTLLHLLYAKKNNYVLQEQIKLLEDNQQNIINTLTEL